MMDEKFDARLDIVLSKKQKQRIEIFKYSKNSFT